MRYGFLFLAALLSGNVIAAPSGEESSLLAALVQKCDLIDDEYMAKKSGTEARRSILRSLRGKIGPISYDLIDGPALKMGGGSGSFGSSYTGDRGPKLFPPGGTYKARTSPEFDTSLKVWKAGYKDKEPRATAEIAAALFTESYQTGTGKLNETKMLSLFKSAAESGDPDAMFMSAVCFYYGIGCEVNRKRANKALEAWKAYSGTTKAKRGGWIARRFAVINK